MKIVLTVTKVVEENSVVARFTPSIVDGQPTDVISGELFLSQSLADVLFAKGSTIEIDLSADEPVEVPEEESEEEPIV